MAHMLNKRRDEARRAEALGELMDIDATERERLSLKLALAQAQAGDLHRQLQEAWDALAWFSGKDYNEAIAQYHDLVELGVIVKENER